MQGTRDHRGDHPLVLDGRLKRTEWVADAQHAVIELIKVLVKREVFLDCELADAVGGDRFRRRGLKRRNLLRTTVDRSARGYEDNSRNAELTAKVEHC